MDSPDEADVTINRKTGEFVWYKPGGIAASDPVFTLGPDGTLTVHKLGEGMNAQMMAKMFWEAVYITGNNYRRQVEELQQMITLLSHDPARDVILSGHYEVHKQLKADKQHVPLATVQKVLHAAALVAAKSMQ